MLGSLAAQYVETPLFVVNSKFDTWQEKAIIGVNCTVSKCPKPEQAFWAAYGKHSNRALFCWRPNCWRSDKKMVYRQEDGRAAGQHAAAARVSRLLSFCTQRCPTFHAQALTHDGGMGRSAFVTNCPAHCQTGTASAWGKRTINGTVMGAGFASWYADRQSGGS